MRDSAGGEESSSAFLCGWIALPAAALVFALLAAPEWEPLAVVSFAALFLAGFAFPFEIERRPPAGFSRLLPLLLFLAPVFLAAGRLSGAGWRGGAAFVSVGLWLAAAWALWRAGVRGVQGLSCYLFFFALLAAGAPFLAYLIRDFGGSPPALLPELSPFTLALRLSEGKGYEPGLAVSGLVAALVWAAYRFASRREKGEGG